MKIAIIGANPHSLVNFRGDLIKNLSLNNKVFALAGSATKSEVAAISKLGATYVNYCVDRNGLNPLRDLITFIQLYFFFIRHKPEKTIAYTIKPVIWGGFASKIFGSTSFYAMITGLGYSFQKGGYIKNCLNLLVKYLYKYSLVNAEAVIFQNIDNMNVFIEERIVSKEKCYLVSGSGVNITQFPLTPLPDTISFLLIARLLGDKGIREYVKAAKLVKQKFPEAHFELVGPKDPSPDGITINEVNEWVESGAISYSGETNDVRSFIKNCAVYVLPSYHEGLPRTVLEAMSMGRPILTTNVPGCRETVVIGKNGWLVSKQNVQELTDKLLWFIENKNSWSEMGRESHSIVVKRFDVNIVNSSILKIIGVS